MLGALRRHKLHAWRPLGRGSPAWALEWGQRQQGWGWVGCGVPARSPLHSAQSQVFLLRPPRHPEVSGFVCMLTFLSRLEFNSVRPGSGTSGTW